MEGRGTRGCQGCPVVDLSPQYPPWGRGRRWHHHKAPAVKVTIGARDVLKWCWMQVRLCGCVMVCARVMAHDASPDGTRSRHSSSSAEAASANDGSVSLSSFTGTHLLSNRWHTVKNLSQHLFSLLHLHVKCHQNWKRHTSAFFSLHCTSKPNYNCKAGRRQSYFKVSYK